MQCYILDRAGNPVKEPDIHKWAKWFEKENFRVAEDSIGDILISTVFVGIDMSSGSRQPMLYETMVFGGGNDGFQERYGNGLAALAGHVRAVCSVRDYLK